MRRRSTAKSKSIPCRPIQTPETCLAFSCPSFSCPSISCLDISTVRHFHVRHFQRPRRPIARRTAGYYVDTRPTSSHFASLLICYAFLETRGTGSQVNRSLTLSGSFFVSLFQCLTTPAWLSMCITKPFKTLNVSLHLNPSQSYEASPAICDRTVFTCHPTQVNALRLNPSQSGRYSTCPPREFVLKKVMAFADTLAN